MLEQHEKIAKKYVAAFYACYPESLNKQTINKLVALASFLKKNKRFLLSFDIPSVSLNDKKNTIHTMLELLDLNEYFFDLLTTLLINKRMNLLEYICHQFIVLYHEKNHIMHFKIATSHPVTDEEKKTLISFISHFLDHDSTIEADFVIDKNLISGIRITSETLMWENSIAQQLSNIKQSMLQQVGL